MKPYDIEAPMTLKYLRETSYKELLEGDSNVEGFNSIKKAGFDKLEDVLFFMEG